jgi:hypothetical protein
LRGTTGRIKTQSSLPGVDFGKKLQDTRVYGVPAFFLKQILGRKHVSAAKIAL